MIATEDSQIVLVETDEADILLLNEDPSPILIEESIGSSAVGPQGEPGLDGPSAYEVAISEGFVGDEATWLASLVGPQGNPGLDGQDGSTGPKGDTGAQGIPGEDGADGGQGPIGPPGNDGTDGPSAYEIAVNEGFVGDEAAWLVSLVGPQGNPGQDGAQGATGAQGPIGPTGPAGADGDDGATGPQGVKGDTGDAGPAGVVGPQGPSGNDGPSAYEVAIAEGFIGDEAAWLASLEGPQGIQGPSGDDGADGAQGPTGATGPQGLQGIQGIQGEPGADGSDADATAAIATHSADTTAVHGIADTSALVLTDDSRLSNSRTPTGSAGGVLAGTYPNPTFAADMATQAELDAVAAAKQDASTAATDAELSAGLATKANISHTHAQSDVTGLTSALAAKQDAATAATDSELSAGLATKAEIDHSHVLSDITDAGSAAASDLSDFDPAGSADLVAADLALIQETTVYPETYGCVGGGVIDDTVNMQSCFDAARALSISLGGREVTIELRNVYLVDQAPRTDREGNCILSLCDSAGAVDTEITTEFTEPKICFKGSRGFGLGRRSIPTRFKTTRTTDTYSATYGPASVIGAATFEQVGADSGIGGAPYARVGPVRFEGVGIELPEGSPLMGIDGISYGGLGLSDVEVYYLNLDSDPLKWAPTAANTHPEAAGIRGPHLWGTWLIDQTDVTVTGAYVGFVILKSDHSRMQRMYAANCVLAWGFQDPHTPGHASLTVHGTSSNCKYIVGGWTPTVGVKSLDSGALPGAVGAVTPFLNDWTISFEQGTAPFDHVSTVVDANNMLFGRIKLLRNALVIHGQDPGSVVGAQNLEIALAPTGHLTTRRTIEPPDNNTPLNAVQGWWDKTSADSKLRFKGRDTGTAVRKGGLRVRGYMSRDQEPKTIDVSGELSVSDILAGFHVPEACQIVRVIATIESGTSATVKIRKKTAGTWSDITGFGGIVAVPAGVVATPTAQSLAANDKIGLSITAVSGTPADLSVTIVTAIGA